MKNVFVCILLGFGFSAAAQTASTCSELKQGTGSCFAEYDGIERARCEVCREGKSCFIALDGPERGLCEAYVENQSCFIALDGSDRGWCEVLKEGQSCFMALDGADRDLCEQGSFPWPHYFWTH